MRVLLSAYDSRGDVEPLGQIAAHVERRHAGDVILIDARHMQRISSLGQSAQPDVELARVAASRHAAVMR